MARPQASATERAIAAEVASDGSVAALSLPAGLAPAAVTTEACLAALQEAQVEITDAVRAAVAKLVASPPVQADKPIQVVVAQATPPRPGVNGSLQWQVGAPPTGAEGAISHYERSAFIFVTRGQVVAKVIPPDPGAPGRDVRGRELAAKPGQPARYSLDATVQLNAAGELVAQADGILCPDPARIGVRKFIEVKENVDFSTGNINFNGDVLIHKGVRDRFLVKAQGSVEVHGLIEAAQIDCGGNLSARGGFAGRERGHATVGGNLLGKYLDNVEALVAGSLAIEREIINCDLVVHGDVRCPRSALIGGRCVAGGVVELATVGSNAHVATELVLGVVPALEADAAALAELLAALQQRISNLDELLQKLLHAGPGEAHSRRKISGELASLRARLSRGRAAQKNLLAVMNQRRVVDLRIDKQLFQGVLLTLTDLTLRIREDVRGPLRVHRHNGLFVYSRPGASPLPLTEVAETRAAA